MAYEYKKLSELLHAVIVNHNQSCFYLLNPLQPPQRALYHPNYPPLFFYLNPYYVPNLKLPSIVNIPNLRFDRTMRLIQPPFSHFFQCLHHLRGGAGQHRVQRRHLVPKGRRWRRSGDGPDGGRRRPTSACLGRRGSANAPRLWWRGKYVPLLLPLLFFQCSHGHGLLLF